MGDKGQSAQGFVDGSRRSRQRRIVARPQQVRGALYIDWQGKTSRQILEGWGLYYPRTARGWSRGWGGGVQYSAALSSSVARHLALFTAVECGVVEEGAAFTVPLGAFEVLVPLGPRHWLRALLPLWQRQQEALYEKKSLFVHRIKAHNTTTI